MPFVRVIKDWHCWVYESHAKQKETNKGATNYATTIIGKIGEISNIQKINSLTTSNSEIRGKNVNTPATVDDLSARLCPPGVELWEEVQWSFEIISIFMDEFGGKGGGRVAQKEKQRGSFRKLDATAGRGVDDGARTALATHIVKVIPAILKTLLLLEEDSENKRRKLFKSPLVRRMLLCPGTFAAVSTFRPSSRTHFFVTLFRECWSLA